MLSVLVPNAPGLFSGMSFTKDLLIRFLTSLSLVFWGYSQLGGHASVRWHRAAWPAVAFAAWATFCMLVSPSPGTALLGAWPQGEAGWLATASYIVAAFLTLQLADSSGRIRVLLRTVVLTAGVVAAYGVLQATGLDPLDWAIAWGEYRSFSTVGNPDMFGAYMVLVLPLSIGLALSETSPRWRGLAGTAFVLVGTAVFTSLTRSAWVGALVGIAALVWLLWRLKPKLGGYEAVLVGILAVSIAGFAVASLSHQDADSNVRERVGGIGTDTNSVARWETWRAAGAAIAERPVVGWGPDGFQLAFESHRTRRFSELVDPSVSMTTAHNWIVQSATEMGVVGLGLLLSSFGFVAVASARWVRHGPPEQMKTRVLFAGAWAACAGFLATSLLTPGSPPARILLWSLLALLLSPQAKRIVAAARFSRGLVPVSALACGTVGVLAAGLVVSADVQADRGADVGQAPLVRVEAADAAVRTNPLHAEYRIVAVDAHTNMVPATGLARPGGKDPAFDKALEAAHRAVALEPANPYRKAALVATLLVGGQDVDPAYASTAVQTAEDAVAQAPNHLYLAYWYARSLRDVGRSDEAMAVLRDVLSLRPGFGMAAILLSDLYVASGDIEAARRVLEASLQQVDALDVRAALQKLGTQID